MDGSGGGGGGDDDKMRVLRAYLSMHMRHSTHKVHDDGEW